MYVKKEEWLQIYLLKILSTIQAYERKMLYFLKSIWWLKYLCWVKDKRKDINTIIEDKKYIFKPETTVQFKNAKNKNQDTYNYVKDYTEKNKPAPTKQIYVWGCHISAPMKNTLTNINEAQLSNQILGFDFFFFF